MKDFRVPTSLDNPKKAFIWDLDTFLIAISGVMIGILSKQMVLSVAIFMFMSWRWGKLKSGKHQWYFLYVLYWYLPIKDSKTAKRIPQTNQREFLK